MIKFKLIDYMLSVINYLSAFIFIILDIAYLRYFVIVYAMYYIIESKSNYL